MAVLCDCDNEPLGSLKVIFKSYNIDIYFADNVAMRGERLELLVNKTENLSANSVTFRKTSRNLARSMFWKNVKLYVIIAVVVAVSEALNCRNYNGHEDLKPKYS
ncbi:hypothetical protein ANN_18381 [Periplaneta americana]|uniref:V-SNARE coiled-coil homology domain-containing protein n=1 Tax=Periplaneta americana TaxID=6978 RepID=A0ABQ8SNL0_PERAM|nr:hypothetical protein ANN_18381 [Periplaneta americana]